MKTMRTICMLEAITSNMRSFLSIFNQSDVVFRFPYFDFSFLIFVFATPYHFIPYLYTSLSVSLVSHCFVSFRFYILHNHPVDSCVHVNCLHWLLAAILQQTPNFWTFSRLSIHKYASFMRTRKYIYGLECTMTQNVAKMQNCILLSSLPLSSHHK